MGKIFKGIVKVRVGGAMNTTTGVMTGGVVVGHFMVDADFSVDRPTLTAQPANGPTVQQADEDASVATIRINALADSVLERNFLGYARAGGYCEVESFSGIAQEDLDAYGPWEFGPFGANAQREASAQNVTLIGTNMIREAAWIEAQADMPEAP